MREHFLAKSSMQNFEVSVTQNILNVLIFILFLKKFDVFQ